MELFRLLESTDLEEVGVFPQRGDSLSDVSVQLSEHVYNYRRFSKVPDNIFVPDFRFRNGSKITDVISLSINSCFIVSARIKKIVEENAVPDVQFVPINFKKDNAWYGYYLLFFLKSRFDMIDFSATDINIMKSVWDVEQVVRVRDVEEFYVLLKEVTYPRGLLMKNPVLTEKSEVDLFSVDKTSNGYGVFVSKRLKAVFDREDISGWQYIPLGNG
jgi:hypothetical protein